MSKVVVIGSSGYAGGHITAELANRGHSVTGVARNASSIAVRDGVSAVAGSLHDCEFIRDVTADADTIVVALPAREIDGAKLIDAVPTLLDAAATTGARLGFVGGAGSLHVANGGPRVLDTPGFPEAYKPEASAHAAVLENLRTSGTDVDWFYVSPAGGFGSYNPGERTGQFRLGDDVLVTDAEGNSNISGADFAIAFADEIENPAHHRARFTLGY